MNVHSKNGSRGARSRTPKLPLCYYLSATSRTPWNVCEELRPQNLLKNERDGFRSPGRSSQTIAYICDLLGEARKRSRAFAISWKKLENGRVHLRSPGRRGRGFEFFTGQRHSYSAPIIAWLRLRRNIKRRETLEARRP